MEGKNVRISDTTHENLVSYCEKYKVKMGEFVDDAVKDKMNGIITVQIAPLRITEKQILSVMERVNRRKG